MTSPEPAESTRNYARAVISRGELPEKRGTTMSRDRDFERVHCGDYQRNYTHFYSIGAANGVEEFAYGYFTPDGFFHHGIAAWNVTEAVFFGERGTAHNRVVPPKRESTQKDTSEAGYPFTLYRLAPDRRFFAGAYAIEDAVMKAKE